MHEAGVPGYESSSWGGLMGPAGLPAAMVARMHADTARALRAPDVQEKLATLGASVVAQGPAEFAEFLKAEIRKWDGVARRAGIRLD